jgi:hypothetical protein
VSSLVRRLVVAAGGGASLRTAVLDGVDHVVVPVVALIGDSVIWPMHSDGPELVPAALLAEAPQQWDGRPVVAIHPGGGLAGANSPEAYRAMKWGTVFGACYRRGRLQMEAWLNLARARELGGAALETAEAIERGEVVEVSVGAWVTVVPERGRAASGELYIARWVTMASDHLAAGLAGADGACSVDMGCGAPRVAASGRNEEVTTVKKPNIIERLLARLKLAQGDDGMSDVDLRDALWSALRSAEPAFEGIVEVFPDESVVVYVTSPEGPPLFWRRSFAVGEDGAVELKDDAEEGDMQAVFVPLAAAESGSPVGEKCTCNGGEADPVAAAEGEEDSEMSEKLKSLVARMIAAKRSPYREGDEAHLEALGEDRLEELVEDAEKEPETVAAPQAEGDDEGDDEETEEVEANVEADTVTVPREKWDEVVAASDAYKAAEKTRRDELAAAIAKKTDAWPLAALAAKPLAELRALVKALGLDEPVRDFSGRGIPVSASAPETVPSPPDQHTFNRLRAAGKSRDEAMAGARDGAASI